MKRVVMFFLIFLFSLQLAACQNFPVYTDKYVNDFANILDINESFNLREIFSLVEENTTAEVVFVSLDSLNGSEISGYATALGELWGVGKADKDNGIVILYVKDINKIWVSVGYGIEGIFPDSKIGRFLDDYYVPYRDREEISEGIIRFSSALAEDMIKNREELLSSKVQHTNPVVTLILFLIIAWIIFRIFEIILSRFNKPVQPGSYTFRIPSSSSHKKSSGLFSFKRHSSGGFGGGGSSGGGFGGGHFGGGGAGR